jgi:N-acetylmuramoyl-L-alanine amidase
MLKRTHIMVHHSLTRDTQTESWAAIRRYHIVHNGWDAIGYHYGVELIGDHYEALLGRTVLAPAAACPQEQMNQRALHVCCVGSYDEAPPPRPLLMVLVQLVIVPAMVEYGIPADHIIGHRDANPAKSCPGTQFDLDVVRRMAAEALKTVSGTGQAGQGPVAVLRRVSPARPARKARPKRRTGKAA